MKKPNNLGSDKRGNFRNAMYGFIDIFLKQHNSIKFYIFYLLFFIDTKLRSQTLHIGVRRPSYEIRPGENLAALK